MSGRDTNLEPRSGPTKDSQAATWDTLDPQEAARRAAEVLARGEAQWNEARQREEETARYARRWPRRLRVAGAMLMLVGPVAALAVGPRGALRAVGITGTLGVAGAAAVAVTLFLVGLACCIGAIVLDRKRLATRASGACVCGYAIGDELNVCPECGRDARWRRRYESARDTRRRYGAGW
jgi:hypothetical protein